MGYGEIFIFCLFVSIFVQVSGCFMNPRGIYGTRIALGLLQR